MGINFWVSKHLLSTLILSPPTATRSTMCTADPTPNPPPHPVGDHYTANIFVLLLCPKLVLSPLSCLAMSETNNSFSIQQTTYSNTNTCKTDPETSMDGQPQTTCAPTEIARMGRCLSGNEKKINSSPASTSMPLFKFNNTLCCSWPNSTKWYEHKKKQGKNLNVERTLNHMGKVGCIPPPMWGVIAWALLCWAIKEHR